MLAAIVLLVAVAGAGCSGKPENSNTVQVWGILGPTREGAFTVHVFLTDEDGRATNEQKDGHYDFFPPKPTPEHEELGWVRFDKSYDIPCKVSEGRKETSRAIVVVQRPNGETVGEQFRLPLIFCGDGQGWAITLNTASKSAMWNLREHSTVTNRGDEYPY